MTMYHLTFSVSLVVLLYLSVAQATEKQVDPMEVCRHKMCSWDDKATADSECQQCCKNACKNHPKPEDCLLRKSQGVCTNKEYVSPQFCKCTNPTKAPLWVSRRDIAKKTYEKSLEECAKVACDHSAGDAKNDPCNKCCEGLSIIKPIKTVILIGHCGINNQCKCI